MRQDEFRNRTVVVTGSARGIGRATAEIFSQTGATVFGVDIADQGNVPWETISIDLGEIDAAEKVLETVPNAEILVNVHGLLEPLTIEDTTVQDFDRAIAINLRSVFFLCQKFAPVMAANGWGRIINFSSVVARTGSFSSAAYAAAKAGVIGTTKSFARRYAAEGVTVNSVVPAAVDTELNSFLKAKQRETIISEIPVGRFSEPEEFVQAIMFLSSDGAGFITGSSLDINGGWVMT